MFNKNKIAKEWINIGADTEQKIMNAVEEAYSNKKRLGLNIYLGKWNNQNICICLNQEEKIVEAFPTAINEEQYLSIKEDVRKLYKGFGMDIEELPLDIISTFIGIDIMNNKEDFLNGEFKNIKSRLFPFQITPEVLVISTNQGGIAIGIEAIKEIICKIY